MLKDMTAKVEGLNATIEATSTKLVQDSKTAACVVGDAAVTVAKRELLEAGDEIGTKVRAMYDNIYSDIRFERWICIGAAIIVCGVWFIGVHGDRQVTVGLRRCFGGGINSPLKRSASDSGSIEQNVKTQPMVSP